MGTLKLQDWTLQDWTMEDWILTDWTMTDSYGQLIIISLSVLLVFRFLFLPERDYVTFGSLLSQFRLSSVCLSVVCLSSVCRL